MKIKYILIFTVFITAVSCSKNEISEEINGCNIAKSTSESSTNDSLVFKYNHNNKLSELTSFKAKCGAKWVFTYPTPNQMVITYQTQCLDNIQDFYPLIVDFDPDGKVIEMKKTPSNGYTISLAYSGNNIVSLFQKSVGFACETRFEYIGNNVSKAYTFLDENRKVLNYEGLKYDNMKTLYTKEYTLFRLYASTFINDGMYDYLSQNNVISYNRYLGAAPPVDKVERTMQYNSHQYPTKIISRITTSYGDLLTSTGNYQYACK